jgi:hypothetical protein
MEGRLAGASAFRPARCAMCRHAAPRLRFAKSVSSAWPIPSRRFHFKKQHFN